MKSSRAATGVIRISLVCLLLLVASSAHLFATGQFLTSGVNPGVATSNSVYEYWVIFQDNPAGAVDPRYALSIILRIDGTFVASRDPYDYDTGDIRNGIRYYFRVSGGLSQKTVGNTSEFYPNISVYHDPGNIWKRVTPCPWLKAEPGGGPKSNHNWRIEALWQGPPNADGTPGTITTLVASGIGPTVHDSFHSSSYTLDRYGGQVQDRDFLYSFPIGYPYRVYCDPLEVLPYYERFPDEGSTTSTYNFRVRYENIDDLKPGAWLQAGYDAWNIGGYGTTAHESGVMLYLRNLDKPTNSYWGVFRGHHMYREDTTRTGEHDGLADYILRVVPMGNDCVRWDQEGGGNHWMNAWAGTYLTNHYYESLPPGRYEYFYACSDDDFSVFGDDKWMFSRYLDDQARTGLAWPNDWSPWPTPAAPYDWLVGWYNGLNWEVTSRSDPYNHDDTSYYGYVDKRTYMPGAWVSHDPDYPYYRYPYDSWKGSSRTDFYGSPIYNMTPLPIYYPAYTYPNVNPGLYQVGSLPLAGGARFLGTLSPHKRGVIPAVPFQDDTNGRLWSESAMGTDQDAFTFRINYWQSNGELPSYVRLYVNDSWNPDDGSLGPNGEPPVAPFHSHGDMFVPGGATPTRAQLKTGVTYQTQPISGKVLGRGPHCYYIVAADREWKDVRYPYDTAGISVGARVVRYPRRPDTLIYDQPGFGPRTFSDSELPNKSPDPSVQIWLPVENDVINGPYINTPPELVPGSWSVTPNVGVAGTEFVFRVRYRDNDNQRPYSPLIIIETDDAGTTSTETMWRSDDRSVPGNSTAQFSDPNGVAYEFRMSSAPGLILQVGSRRYKFDFIDDWGRQNIPTDRISGEHIAAIQQDWAGGFLVSGNTRPRLSNGSVLSADGTSNDATTWNYSVTYTDANNNPEAYIIVYIGRQDTPTGQIVWDSGHAMTAADPNDKVFSDGRVYIFSTKLSGNTVQPIKYYSCFVASDGIDPAEYNVTTSPSSGMIWQGVSLPLVQSPPTGEILTPASGSVLIFNTDHTPIVTAVPPSSQQLYPTNYSNPVIYNSAGVRQTQQTQGIIGYTIDNLAGTITFPDTMPPPSQPVRAYYWFGTPPDPILGPWEVTGNRAPTLADGKVIPTHGSSTDTFTYSVTYTDLDGQAPAFVNAVIDDVRHDMTKVTGSSTYKTGVTYQCQTGLGTGSHQFYFESSDGAALALFDNDMSNTIVDPIPGPYINDRPKFTGAQITPSGMAIDASQPVTYSITYSDNDGDQPMPGYPVVYVDNPSPETEWNGTVYAFGNDFIEDTFQTWQTDKFKGMPLELTIASTSQRIVYKIGRNEGGRFYLITSALPDGLMGSTFTIGKLVMDKQDPSDQVYTDGVAYEARVPSLGAGSHTAHFKAIANEQVMPGVYQQYTLRAPVSGELSGPTVEEKSPVGNRVPTLTNGGVTPRTGTAGTPFKFHVTYTDADGDSPDTAHNEVLGYIRLKIEESPGVWVTYDLGRDLDAPDYTAGVEFNYTLGGLSLGPHNFYFEASDGVQWGHYVRAPAAPPAIYTVYVSRPPILSEGSVNPTSGNIGRVYEYKVKYRDPDADPPQYIKLVVDKGRADELTVDIGVPMPGADYQSGVVYSYPLLKGSLHEEDHTFYFVASDGNGYAWYDQDVRDAGMGRLARGTPDVFTDGLQYVADSADCTLAVLKDHPLTSTGGSITFTVTGKNQSGVAGRTWKATFTSPADYAAGTEKALVPTISGDTIADVTGIAADAWTGGEVYVKTPNPIKNSTTSTPTPEIRPINEPSIHSNSLDGPILSDGKVKETSGFDKDTYVYSVTYRDPDGDEPEYVDCYIDDPNPANPYPMTKNPSQNNYSIGVSYTLTKIGLGPGPHSYYFKTSDWDRAMTTTPVNNEPVVSPRPTPTITLNRDMGRLAQSTPDVFTDGLQYLTGAADCTLAVAADHPLTSAKGSITFTVTGKNQSGVAGQTWKATFASPADYVAGTEKALVPTIGGDTIADVTGITADAWTGGEVYVRADKIKIKIGTPATIIGTATCDGSPLAFIPIVITITRPDSTQLLPSVTTSASGQFTYTWTPAITGTWKVQASCVESGKYLASTSPGLTITVVLVLEETFSVSGLDMISIPIQPVYTFPDGVFDPVPAFALAMWRPAKMEYRFYSLLPGIRTDYDFLNFLGTPADPAKWAGQAYWIKTLVTKPIAPRGSLVPFTDFPVTLGVGWNQVGCPFTTDIPWSTLKVRRTINGVTSGEVSLATAAANKWIREYGWTYNPAKGGYELVDATRAVSDDQYRYMRPWRGYWMRVMVGCQLVIPAPNQGTKATAPLALSAATLESDTSEAAQSSAKWQVQLIAKNGSLEDACNYLGASRSSDERMESPACFRNYVDLYFTDANGHVYASDLRSDVSSGCVWRFDVATDKPGEVELTWEGLSSLPEGGRLALTDLDGKSVWMSPGGSFKFNAEDGQLTRSFEVTFEKE